MKKAPATSVQKAKRFRPFVPIVRSSKLWLVRPGYGNEDKFVAAFRSAWFQIPYRDRRVLTKHWRTDRARILSGLVWPDPRLKRGLTLDFKSPLLVSPAIHLLEGWDVDQRYFETTPEKHRGEYAAVFRNGHKMLFWSVRFDLMPTDVAASVIAHELMHVMQCALGYEVLFGTKEPDSGDLEQHADEMMEYWWDFDPFLIDRWGVEMGFYKHIECKDFAEYCERAFGEGSRYYIKP